MDKIIRKISVKTVTGMSPKQIREHAAKTPNKPIMAVVGIAHGTKAGESANGPWMALTGDFVAVNIATGMRFRSGIAFLEKGAEAMVLGALQSSDGGVEFGFNVFVREDEDSATGYVYECQSLIEPAESDPLNKLLSSVQKSLPKPAETAEEAPAGRGRNRAKQPEAAD